MYSMCPPLHDTAVAVMHHRFKDSQGSKWCKCERSFHSTSHLLRATRDGHIERGQCYVGMVLSQRLEGDRWKEKKNMHARIEDKGKEIEKWMPMDLMVKLYLACESTGRNESRHFKAKGIEPKISLHAHS